MVKLFLINSFLILVSVAFAAPSGMTKSVLKVSYYNKMFGHIHRNPSRYSSSLSTISCGHPVKVYKFSPKKGSRQSEQIIFNDIWHYVKAGPYEGYMRKDYLSATRPKCFQDKFPRFFDHLEVEISDLYYWGKLYDQYLYGKSRVK